MEICLTLVELFLISMIPDGKESKNKKKRVKTMEETV